MSNVLQERLSYVKRITNVKKKQIIERRKGFIA